MRAILAWLIASLAACGNPPSEAEHRTATVADRFAPYRDCMARGASPFGPEIRVEQAQQIAAKCRPMLRELASSPQELAIIEGHALRSISKLFPPV